MAIEIDTGATAGGRRSPKTRPDVRRRGGATLIAAVSLFAACSIDERYPTAVTDPPDPAESEPSNEPNPANRSANEEPGSAPGGTAGSDGTGLNMDGAPTNGPLAPNGSPTSQGDSTNGAALPGAEASAEPAATRSLGPSPTGSTNLFSELLGIPEAEVDAKLTLATHRVFGIGTNEPFTPSLGDGFRLYYELPQDPNLAFIWSDDSSDIRSEGIAYGMMIAVQMDLHDQFDRLWNFAQAFVQYPDNDPIVSWRRYLRWQGRVDTSNALSWAVSFVPDTGPAPDADEYLAAALYLADQRWKSTGSVNYHREADGIATALLNNMAAAGRTPIFDAAENKVVYFPSGAAAGFSNPSFHLPAFYDLFAANGPVNDSARWRQIAEVSRQYLVASAHATTGLHPDYADFDGTPNTGGSNHDLFQYDAWRVIMNMAVDYAWLSNDARLQTQIEKYHAFFGSQLAAGSVQSSIFALDGSGATGGSSSALVATLAAGALGSAATNRATFVQALWDIQQPTGSYRYYQEILYMLGLLNVAGRFGYGWPETAP